MWRGVKLAGEKEFKCEECTYAASTKQRLLKHVKGVHKKLKPYKCEKCPYVASLKQHLPTHLIGVHEKLKSFK